MEQPGQVEVHLLTGCCHEAERAEIVWFRLEGLKSALSKTGHPHLDMTIEELRTTTRILRELADLSQVHQDRVPVVLNHLNIILPSLSRSLRDITSHYEDTKLSKQNRWRKMYHVLTKEAGGLLLPQRFLLYNQFLNSLKELLARSPNFELNQLESMRLQITRLRDAQAIPPPPVPVGPLVRYEAMSAPDISPVMTILGIILIKHAEADKGPELVLMYCTFLSLKSFNRLTLQVGLDEYHLRGERKLFQARILDDGFRHSLIVYEDRLTGGYRLHAAIWDGELRQCPVWTAFVTHQSASVTWIKRVSRHKVRLADIQLYVFCQKYQPQNQRRGSSGAFEIYFVSEEASQRFSDVFTPSTDDESPDSQ
ncbi:hypothetical protein HJFPF1_00780 [Paramyrothecium foliicola]|nr:hypothetical protein HJFPF1_00780 [Paramyrothecium foliicola]